MLAYVAAGHTVYVETGAGLGAGFSDKEYESMIKVLRNVEGIKEVRQVTGADLSEKIRLFELLRRYVSCSNMQIAKFLHLELDGGGD